MAFTEAKTPGDVVKYEPNELFSRRAKLAKDATIFAVGDVLEVATGKVQRITASANAKYIAMENVTTVTGQYITVLAFGTVDGSQLNYNGQTAATAKTALEINNIVVIG
jgi:hypothetical protein